MDLSSLFTYHAPTEETEPKYAAIRAAEAVARKLAERVDSKEPPTFDEVNAVLKAFAQTILDNSPRSADQTAAIRCVRLARNALNEAIATNYNQMFFEQLAQTELIKARWQACSAVALNGAA